MESENPVMQGIIVRLILKWCDAVKNTRYDSCDQFYFFRDEKKN